jgi:hypothetical protein
MAFQPAPNCAEAVIRCTYGGKEVVNVLNFFSTGGYTQSDLDNLAGEVDIYVGASYLPNLSPDLEYIETHVRGLANASDLEAHDNGSAGFGTAGGTSLPANVTLAIKMTTGFTGRSNRGRLYSLPNTDAALTGPNMFNVTFATDIIAFLTSVQTGALSVGWNMVVLSRFTLGAPRTTATHRVITGFSYTDLKADSQRGRLK